MITICKGNIFDSECDALVNPVNCVGVTGAGLAKQFKEKYPMAYYSYRSACGKERLFTTHIFAPDLLGLRRGIEILKG